MSEADEDGDDMKRRFGGQDAACLSEGNKLSQSKGADEAEGTIRASATHFSIALIKITHRQKCISNYCSLYS